MTVSINQGDQHKNSMVRRDFLILCVALLSTSACSVPAVPSLIGPQHSGDLRRLRNDVLHNGRKLADQALLNFGYEELLPNPKLIWKRFFTEKVPCHQVITFGKTFLTATNSLYGFVTNDKNFSDQEASKATRDQLNRNLILAAKRGQTLLERLDHSFTEKESNFLKTISTLGKTSPQERIPGLYDSLTKIEELCERLLGSPGYRFGQ